MTRISYHSFGPETNRAYLGLLASVIEHRAKGAEVVLDATPGASVGAKQSRSLHPLDVAVLSSRVWHAEQDGADVAVIGNIQDPGLAECRGLVDIPVVGLLESVFSSAVPFGRSVAFVCTHRRVEALIRERAAAYGMTDRLHGFAFLDVDLRGLSRVLTEPQAAAPVLERVAELEIGLREAGADVVAAGSGMLDVLVQTSGRTRLLSPITAALAMARAAADLRRAGVPVARREPIDAAEVERYIARVDALVSMERTSRAP